MNRVKTYAYPRYFFSNESADIRGLFVAACGLVERGLAGVRLVISDAHRGLVAAVRETLLGAAWQRCRVHFTRNAQALVPRGAAGMVASAIRSIFEQPDEHAACEQLRRVADGLVARFPAVAELLTEAEPDLLVRFTFPDAHRPRIRSTNPRSGSTRRSSAGRRWSASSRPGRR